MSDGLRLHPVHGVNPRMTTCQNCGESVGLALIGANDYKETCRKCGMVHYGGAEKGKCQGCGERRNFERLPIGEHETLPGGLCPACEKAIEEENTRLRALCEAGGILFRCRKCGARGGIHYAEETKEFCDEIRQKAGGSVMCGVEFEDCESHGGASGGDQEEKAGN